MVSVCHVTSQDYEIKGSCDIMGTRPSKQAVILISLVAIVTLVMEIKQI